MEKFKQHSILDKILAFKNNENDLKVFGIYFVIFTGFLTYLGLLYFIIIGLRMTL